MANFSKYTIKYQCLQGKPTCCGGSGMKYPIIEAGYNTVSILIHMGILWHTLTGVTPVSDYDKSGGVDVTNTVSLSGMEKSGDVIATKSLWMHADNLVCVLRKKILLQQCQRQQCQFYYPTTHSNLRRAPGEVVHIFYHYQQHWHQLKYKRKWWHTPKKGGGIQKRRYRDDDCASARRG